MYLVNHNIYMCYRHLIFNGIFYAVLFVAVTMLFGCRRGGHDKEQVLKKDIAAVDSGFYYSDDDEMFVGVRSVTTRDADGERLNCLEYDGSGRLSREYLYVSDSAVLMREIVRNGAGRVIRERRYDFHGGCIGEERQAYTSSGLLKAVIRVSAGDTVAYAVSRQFIADGLFCETEDGVSRDRAGVRDVRLKFFHKGRISQVVELVGFGDLHSERRREIFVRDGLGRIVIDSLFVGGQLTSIKSYTYNNMGDREKCLLVMPRYEFETGDDDRFVQRVVGSDSTAWSYLYVYDSVGRWKERRQYDGIGNLKDLLFRNFDFALNTSK